MMNRRILLTGLLAVCLGTTLLSCIGPTLPLPPPEAPDQIAASSDEGLWDIRGSCAPGAMVLVRNERTGVIAGTEDASYRGRYLLQLRAERCDAAVVFEIVGSEVTTETPFIVRETVAGVPSDDCHDAGD